MTCTNSNITARCLNTVERTSVHNQIFDNRKGFRPERLYVNSLPVIEFSHVELAGSSSFFFTVRTTVYCEGATSTNTFSAVVIESYRFISLVHKVFIENIQHFEKGHVFANVIYIIFDKFAFR